MPSKIVIKLPMEKAKNGNTAMKVAAGMKGVTKVEICAKFKDRVIVIGEGINPVELTTKLMKKIGKATSLISVEQLKKPGMPDNQMCDKIIGLPVVDNCGYKNYCDNYIPPQPYYNCPQRVVMYDPYPTDHTCSIL